jgi:hypothetical protein
MTILEQLERDLGELVERRWAAREGGARGSAEPRIRRRRFAPGAFVALAGVAVAVAVAVLAVVLLGHRGPAVRGGPVTTASELSRDDLVPRSRPTLGWLLPHFEVLRRPQTAGDLVSQVQVRVYGGGVISSLTRVARTLPGGARVILTVSRQGGGGRVVLLLWVVRGGQIGGEPYDADVGYTVSPGSLAWNGRSEVWASLVPDGVARVRWVFPRQNGVRTHVYPRPLVIDVPVQGNVAAAEVERSATWEPAVVTWYDRAGRVLATFRERDPNQVLPPFPGLATFDVLRAAGIAGVRFGVSSAVLARALRPMLGAPAGPYPQGQCNFDHELLWPGLTVNLARGRFVGYTYAPVRRGQRAILDGDGNLRVGEPVSAVRARYGATFTTTAAQGGAWALRTRHGRLAGLLSEPPARAGARIATISAGVLGCPALSP